MNNKHLVYAYHFLKVDGNNPVADVCKAVSDDGSEA